MKGHNCFIMGLPNAGKTCFLAALWYAVCQGEKHVSLELSRMEGDMGYLKGISDQWLEYEPPAATKRIDEARDITMRLTDGKNGYAVQVSDLSGERFINWYVSRKIEEDLAEQIKAADSIIFFINVKDIIYPIRINEVNQFFDTENGEAASIPRDKIKHDPAAVKIVELLQFVSILRAARGVKLGIVFSAWDLIEESTKSPEEYAKEQLPLLWQFLSTNKNCFDVSYWGVGAWGAATEDREKLQSISHPYDRIQVVNTNGEKTHDITSVLYKILEEIDG